MPIATERKTLYNIDHWLTGLAQVCRGEGILNDVNNNDLVRTDKAIDVQTRP
jgi:hypothetical protein